MSLAIAFISIFPTGEPLPQSGLCAKLMVHCTNGTSFGPFALDRAADGDLTVNCYVSTPAIDDPLNPMQIRLMQNEECHEVEKLAATVLASLVERGVKCGHGGWETGASSDASASSSSLPMNPYLEGESPITIRHVREDIFETADGRKVRFNDLTFVEDDDYPDDDIFKTSTGQRVRIIQN